MWTGFKIVAVLIVSVGLFMTENNPIDLRNNICAWDIIENCQKLLVSMDIVSTAQLLLWLLLIGSLFSFVGPFVLADYRRTNDFIGTTTSSRANQDEQRHPPDTLVPLSDYARPAI